MASYKVSLKPSIEKDFRLLPRDVCKRALERISSLAQNPLPAGIAKIAGPENVYRLRLGDYRIIYNVDHQSHEVVVQHVRHRKDIYRKR